MCTCMQPRSILPKPPCPVHDYERVFPAPVPVLGSWLTNPLVKARCV